MLTAVSSDAPSDTAVNFLFSKHRALSEVVSLANDDQSQCGAI